MKKIPAKIDLLNGIIISFNHGRDGDVIELNIDGTKKKLSRYELESLINSLILAKQWFSVKNKD